MARLRPADRWLLGIALAGFTVVLVLHVDRNLAGGAEWLPVYVTRGSVTPGSIEAAEPVVQGFWSDADREGSALEPGDTIISVAGTDLAGQGQRGFALAVYAAAAAEAAAPVRVRRAGQTLDLELRLRAVPAPWRLTLLSIAYVLVGTLAFVRARGARPARLWFLTSVFYAAHWCYFFGGSPLRTETGAYLFALGAAAGIPLALRTLLVFIFPSESNRAGIRYRRFAQLGPWAFAALGFFAFNWAFWGPVAAPVALQLAVGGSVAWLALAVALLTVGFRRAHSQGRRQIKWVLLGLWMSFLAIGLVGAVTVRFPSLWWLYEWSLLALIAIPICVGIALVRDHLFDIDGLLSSAASFTLLSVVFLALALFAAPRIAELLSGVIDPNLSQASIALVAALGLVVSRQHVEPRLERLLFRDRARFEDAVPALRKALRETDKPADLFDVLAHRLDEALRPRSLALYATADAFAPAWARGPVLAPEFAIEGSVVRQLSLAEGPVRAARLLRSPGPDSGDVECAALAHMGVEVLVPLRVEETLVAFVALSDKRSGDVYTAPELLHLDAVAAKAGQELLRFDREMVKEEKQGMIERLERYVPEAIASDVRKGRATPEGEREVSVLFVDIRGYVSLSEGQPPRAIFGAISRYTADVSQVVAGFGGTVVDLSGDGVMAAFGAAAPLPDKAGAALGAARGILAVLEGREFAGGGGDRIQVGIGIATGQSFVGTLEAAGRRTWCVLGNATNLAARLQSMTRDLDVAVLIDEATWQAAQPADFRDLGPTPIRGRSVPVGLYSLGTSLGTPLGSSFDSSLPRSLETPLDYAGASPGSEAR